jgi:hypothetical protein
MRNARVLVLAISLVLACIPALAQVATGTPPFGSFAGGPDVINLGNLNANWTIPILNKTGRGMNFVYNVVYDSSVWYPVTSGSTTSWQPVANWGWQGLSAAATNAVSASYSVALIETSQCDYPNSGSSYYVYLFSNVAYVDNHGTSHSIPFNGTYLSSPGGQGCPASGANPSGVQQVGLGSGLIANIEIQGSSGLYVTITMNEGKVISPASTSPQAGVYSQTDSNWNEITATNGVYTDTLGQQALTVASDPPNVTLSYPNPSGGNPSTYTVNYTAQNILTNFGCSNSAGPIVEYSATGVMLPSTITLPDGTSYEFTYEKTTQNSSTYTGRRDDLLYVHRRHRDGKRRYSLRGRQYRGIDAHHA